MELFVETHVRSQDRQKGAQQFVDNRAQHFVETYNNRLRERYGDDTLTHPEFDPDLWMEVGSSGGPDKNWVYGLSNTTTDNLRSTRSVSTVGSSQSISSSQSKEFVALQQLTEKYDNLKAEYTQLKAEQRAESKQLKAVEKIYGFALGCGGGGEGSDGDDDGHGHGHGHGGGGEKKGGDGGGGGAAAAGS
ncbi:uncharacterized protein LOC127905261 [Populus trichocarpa]|uniref:uncharacterized protein LOC127905261 n=1 Tax=Populus trichocarpa TaxID=3694 RepID=UPI0022785FF9|nr:uncharacterized protein LOC127905261 [Populus trichocarpa]